MGNVITCEDVLSATVCHDLRAIAAKLKVKIEMIDEIIRQLVKEKITEAKEIIKRVREKLVELATNFKCTDILSENVCKEIKDLLPRSKLKLRRSMKSLRRLSLTE